MVVKAIDNSVERAGGSVIAVFHRVVNAAVAGSPGKTVVRSGNIVIRGAGLGLALSGFRRYSGPRVRVSFRVSVV